MKKFRVQRALVILLGCVCGILQIFYYSILKVCFPVFLRDYKAVADGIAIAVFLCLAVCIYVYVTMILKANSYLWTLRQRMNDCAYVKLRHLTEETRSAEDLCNGVVERAKGEGWGCLEGIEFCGSTYDYLLVKATACVYLKQAEHLEAESIRLAQKALLEHVDVIGYRKRQEALLCFCCETVDEAAKEAAKVCMRRGKTVVYSAVLEASTGRAYCLLTDRKGQNQDNICQKTLIKLALGFPGGTVPGTARSEEKNPEAPIAGEELKTFDLISFWKVSR